MKSKILIVMHFFFGFVSLVLCIISIINGQYWAALLCLFLILVMFVKVKTLKKIIKKRWRKKKDEV